MNRITEESPIIGPTEGKANMEMVRPLTVLLVDVSAERVQFVRESLCAIEGSGVEIEWASLLSRALELLDTHDFDAVLLDLTLPDSQGIETCYQITERSPQTPVIVMTSLEQKAQAVRAVREWAEDYLIRDRCDGELILRTIRCAVERSWRRQAEASLHRTAGQLAVARRIQAQLLPKAQPSLQGFDIAGVSKPAEAIGGDYFDYVRLPGGQLGLAVGDASGHGPGAALVMAQVSACIRCLASGAEGVGHILNRTNQVLVESTPDDQFMSLWLGRFDPVSRSFAYASAGHCTGYLFDVSGAVRQRLHSTQRVLGATESILYPECGPIPMRQGDTLLLLTDGVLEAFNSEGFRYGEERTLRTAHSARGQSAIQMVQSVCDDVAAFRGDAPVTDDMTVVVVKATM